MNTQDNEPTNYFDQSIMDYKQGSSRLQKHLPEVVQEYFDFTEACFREGAVSEKNKQLTALGISMYAQDEYCIIYHAKGAVEHGATEEEMTEIIAVSAALGGGAAFSQGVTLAMDAFDFYKQQIH